MGPKVEFDAYADDYESALGQGLAVSGEGREFFAHGRLAFLRDCLRERGPAPARVMDFGCGTGTSVPIIRELFRAETIVGVDESARSIERAAAKHAAPGVTFSVSDGFVAQANFDLVYTSGVFHHVPVPQRPATFAFLRDALRPGGLLAVWENNPWSLPARYVMSRIPFDRDAVMLSARRVRQLARAQGFRVLRTDYLFIFPAALRRLRPLELMARRAPLGAQYQVLCAKSV